MFNDVYCGFSFIVDVVIEKWRCERILMLRMLLLKNGDVNRHLCYVLLLKNVVVEKCNNVMLSVILVNRYFFYKNECQILEY